MTKHRSMFRFTGIIIVFFLMFAWVFSGHPRIFEDWSIRTAYALPTEIDPAEPNHWAWNDVIGWIDFCRSDTPGHCTVDTAPPGFTNYANSSVGYIALNCNNVALGFTCSGPAGNWKVMRDPVDQTVIGGWAWNDVIGWISFCGDSTGGSTWDTSDLQNPKWKCPLPSATSYGVTILSADFSNWAWNDVIGWISFNCTNTGTCGIGGVDYKTKTILSPPVTEGSLVSSTFKMSDEGAAVNSIMWQGDKNNGTVSFKIATSDCPNGATDPPGCVNGGTWSSNTENCASPHTYFLGPLDTCAKDDRYTVAENTPIQIKQVYHKNRKYLRYEVFIRKGTADNDRPVVRDVILNYSP